jgi:uncharacterized membrane protein
MTDQPLEPPSHVEETARAIARLHAQHRRDAAPAQRAIDAVTAFVARPLFLGIMTMVIGLWLAWNGLGATAVGTAPFDPPPFPWLQGIAQVTALYVTVSILATQRRENELGDLRQQLTLELAVLNEKKAAKIIELIEEVRRDSSDLQERSDPEAAAMASPNDPELILAAIKESHAALAGSETGAEQAFEETGVEIEARSPAAET